MKTSSMTRLLLAVSVMLAHVVVADIYLHNPAGTNNRNRERTQANRNNNRLYDDQDNDNGGYAWRGDRTLQGQPDPMVYYEGSILRIQWTSQHSCGPGSNAACDTVLQYACEDTMPGLRDGYPTGPLTDSPGNNGYQEATFVSEQQESDGTEEIPMPRIPGSTRNRFPADHILNTDEDAQRRFYENGETFDGYVGMEFGLHESYDYYKKCARTERNKGLFIADRNLNGESARFTRQRNNGDRFGFECPEERDYYPYWRETPWKDVAIFTNNMSWCNFYLQSSQNNDPKYECVLPEDSNELAPISELKCGLMGGSWRQIPSHNLPPPECMEHPIAQDNHLGGVSSPDGVQGMAHYDWRIPSELAVQDKLCIFRIRYNISTGDYANRENYADASAPFTDWKSNCEDRYNDTEAVPDALRHCSSRLTEDSTPLIDRPYVRVFDDIPRLAITMNTNQAGRVFQHRSYVFKVQSRPEELKEKTIWNLNTRGKRGNIVQAYPSVEYDFVPSTLTVSEDDMIHIQWTGSDFNQQRNPNNGIGWEYSDRFNMVEMATSQSNFPVVGGRRTMFDEQTAKRLAMVDQDMSTCKFYDRDDDNENNAQDNCGKLNAAPAHFNLGVIPAPQAGEYHYMSTRNNNFSNRSQKGKLIVLVSTWLTPLVIAMLSAAGVVLGGSGAMSTYAYYRPDNPLSRQWLLLWAVLLAPFARCKCRNTRSKSLRQTISAALNPNAEQPQQLLRRTSSAARASPAEAV